LSKFAINGAPLARRIRLGLGAETVEALTTEMRARNELYLWWD
jgi:hypothetical protein